MRKFTFGLSALVLCAFFSVNAQHKKEVAINQVLDAWHKAAANAQFDTYFGLMTPDAIFIGTDATENWDVPAFKKYAKPHFDKGKAWAFMALERHVFVDSSGKMAWFDELLDTQMKICRGSGVLVKVGKDWKIKHYVLSMTIPNENVSEVIKVKAPIEEKMLVDLKSNKKN